jgi:protein tyrosine phosphatase (PTP) superfamily phosphohydrolase (DUF442 family)
MLKKARHTFFMGVAVSLALFSGSSGGTLMEDADAGPVMNYHRINDRLVTGGRLLEGGSAALKIEGVTVVINLLDDPPKEEQQQFLESGIKWTNIPIEWLNPTAANFDRFSEVMREYSGNHVLVQCAANYRASTMTYLYRIAVENVAEDEARKDMTDVWNPNEYDIWREYINDIRQAND